RAGFGGDRGPLGSPNQPPDRDPDHDHVLAYTTRPDQPFSTASLATATRSTRTPPSPGDVDFVALAAPDKRGVRGMLFWQVPEPKTAKNRMHVDLAAKDPTAESNALSRSVHGRLR